MNRRFFLLLPFLIIFLLLFTQCKKQVVVQKPQQTTCDSICHCEQLKAILDTTTSIVDSTLIVHSLNGLWRLKCVEFVSKYGNVTRTANDSLHNVLKVSFTDSTYTYTKDDTILFTNPYSIHNQSVFGFGRSFYYGALSYSECKINGNHLRVSTVYPYTGSYNLILKKLY